MKPWFNARKAAQVAAFFAQKEGGRINVLKLTKLVYLADRTHMKAYDYPIIGDEFVSMPHGPVNSMTLNYIDGCVSENSGWDEFITDRDRHCVGLTNINTTVDDLDELSESEIATLQAVWIEFGHMGQFEIRDWTHKNCPEWEDPDGSSNPIPYERVFKYLGKTNVEYLGERIREERCVREAFVE
ncbi:MAG: Panacea domain-containing protein [Bdellovibrionales bacterium]